MSKSRTLTTLAITMNVIFILSLLLSTTDLSIWMLFHFGWVGYFVGGLPTYVMFASLITSVVFNRIYLMSKIRTSKLRPLIGAGIILLNLLLNFAIFFITYKLLGKT